MSTQASISKCYILENEGTRQRGTSGKDILMQEELVTLSSSAAADVPCSFAPGETVYVLPLYKEVVQDDGNIDVDFSAAADGAVKLLIFGKGNQLKSGSDSYA